MERQLAVNRDPEARRSCVPADTTSTMSAAENYLTHRRSLYRAMTLDDAVHVTLPTMSGGTRRRERKVTVVLRDLVVVFTARAASPWIRRTSKRSCGLNHQRVRSSLSAAAARLEKFIGDAVMALFGAPTAHEDDPERLARAAPSVTSPWTKASSPRWASQPGEALVVDARPDAGQGMVRGRRHGRQTPVATPVNGVITDETTNRATVGAIDYSEVEPVDAKGKAELIPARKLSRRTRCFGVDLVGHGARPALVGRDASSQCCARRSTASAARMCLRAREHWSASRASARAASRRAPADRRGRRGS